MTTVSTSTIAAQATAASSDSASPSSAAPAASARQTITNFMRDVLARLDAPSGTSSIGISLRWKLDLLVQSLPAYAPSRTDATPQATNLAANTLDQLAA
jgi:hypothetical protein